MRKPRSSLSTPACIEAFPRRELPLLQPSEPPRPLPVRERRPADRIKEALQRWLEEEL